MHLGCPLVARYLVCGQHSWVQSPIVYPQCEPVEVGVFGRRLVCFIFIAYLGSGWDKGESFPLPFNHCQLPLLGEGRQQTPEPPPPRSPLALA